MPSSWNSAVEPPTPFERARRRTIARRLPLFAMSWLATTVAWAVVLVFGSGGTALAFVATVVFQAAVLAAAHAACRRDPSAARVPAVAAGACVALALSTTALCAATHAHAHVLAFMLLTLYLGAALLFVWGWKAELIVVATTLAAGMVAFPVLDLIVPPLEFAIAVAIGSAVSLAVAEGSARTFRLAFLHRADEQARRRELEASHAAYRDLAENARDLIYTADLDARFTYANEALAHFLGEPAATLCGRAIGEYVTDHPANPDPARILARVAVGEVLPPFIVQARTPQGPRWLEALISEIRDAGGHVVGVRGISRDVTERKQAEDALRANEERWRSLSACSPVGIFVADTEGRCAYVNPRSQTIAGFTLAEALGDGWLRLVHPDDRARVEREWRAAVRQGIAGSLRFRFEHAKGGCRWVRCRASQMRSDAGVPLGWVGTVEDVTDRTRAEDALRASEERYRGLVESQQDLIARFDRRGRFTFVNDAYCEKVGKRRAELLGASFRPLIHPRDEAGRAAAMRRLDTPPHRARVETRSPTPQGWRWISWEACVIKDGRGATSEIQAVGRDVTERRAAEDALRASLEELRRSEEKLRLLAQRQALLREEERKRLGFDLHDDVCQELIGIAILVESLRRRVAPDGADGAEGEIDRIVRYLNEVVEHLRLLARDLRPFMLHDLGLEGSLRSLAGGMSSTETRVTAQFTTAIPRLDEQAEVAVYRVAQEALANAVRHAAARTVALTLGVTDGMLCLEVRDDGRGFNAEGRERSEALGLVSMEERALALGGRFEVRSAPGNGTAVRLQCPVTVRTPASAA